MLEDLMGERHQRLLRIRALRASGTIDDQLRWTDAGSGEVTLA
jgi:hypothetical protein